MQQPTTNYPNPTLQTKYTPTTGYVNPNPSPSPNPTTSVMSSSSQTRSHVPLKDKCLPWGNQTGYGVGTITFRPIEARFIHDKDILGKMDPYCKFKIGWRSDKSSVGTGQGKNARWNDSLVIKTKNHAYAKVKVKDRDRLTFNDRLGSAKIPLEDLYKTGRHSQWIALAKGDQVTGEIYVEMEYVPKNPGVY